MPEISDIVALRANFPGASRGVYMNTAARGLMMTQSRVAIDAMLDDRLYDGGDKAAMFDLIERTRGRYAALINAAPEEIAYIKNVSEGLNAIIAAFDWRDGDNMVLCAELEHPNNVIPWRHLARRRGVEIRAVAPREGQIPIEAVAAAMDARTRMVTASSVTFAPGFRTDMAAIGRLCRDRDALFLVDGVQSVGILATDVADLGIDAMSVSTQKGLLGLYGMGFLYCRRDWAERLTPIYLSRFGVDLGADAHEAAMGDGDDRLMPAARRFDLGNYNYTGAAAVDASIAVMLDAGPRAIEAYVTGLAARLAGGLLDLGLPVCGGVPEPGWGSSIVAVGVLGEGQHDSVDDPAMSALHEHLAASGVQLSIRRGILRFSLHVHNSEADIARVLDLARGHAR
jgi:cysteine desulfurase/selenocysteine lyase